ncbi:hypothetical protein GIB67_010102 [Kingdonia uniflora]|uniref:Uncharacterized protein n=1 Tax=Kingdonia uniflora TaxID=39325 RepID=A0A7J7NSX6_9MAGN|nr:hypothetical protein GIB67_010102 [Kingdonia uniflora]
MCILCVIQKWSRRVATMLPWLVIPLIGLWALSQLLPPGFRFEVTSPRLACVLVLLVTLFWYEILMPQLSAWRARRSAWLRERKRVEAIEMQKLRKMATRRCRNCFTPYRDQNPVGGRFMCSYCGHVSKRPVLDMNGPSGLGSITNSGMNIRDLIGKGGKLWNGKGCSENGWSYTFDWLENGSTVFSGDDRCLAENSDSGVYVTMCRLVASFTWSIRWLCKTIFRFTLKDSTAMDAERKDMVSKKVENGVGANESKGEKARRKAEEKRQARLERELLEQEERKQREEVARLVEERRRLRDEKMESEKQKENDTKRETERKRQERKKEKDKGSSKSNSDCEELDKRAGRETEKKREFDKRSESERRDLHNKVVMESVKGHISETGHATKASTSNSYGRGNGVRYLDRVKGSFLSSSKAFNGASFFGKSSTSSATVVSNTSKPISSVDHLQASVNKNAVHSTNNTPGKLTSSEANFCPPVASNMQPHSAPRKSWQQLFTRSPAVPSDSATDVTGKSSQNTQAEPHSSSHYPVLRSDDQILSGQLLPFTLPPYPNGFTSSSSISSSAAEPIFPPVRKMPFELMSDEPEIFEDPCYVPDPVSLLGPVSESLDIFTLDVGTGFVRDMEFGRLRALRNVSASAEVNKLSPIESPMSRSRLNEDRHVNSSPFPSTPITQRVNTSPSNESNDAYEAGTWQMWGSPPLGQDRLCLVGGPSSWLSPLAQAKPIHEEVVHLPSLKAMPSSFKNDKQILSGTCSPQRVCFNNCQNTAMFSPRGSVATDNDRWLFQPPLGVRENQFPPIIRQEDIYQNEAAYGTPGRSATILPFDPSTANCWSK